MRTQTQSALEVREGDLPGTRTREDFMVDPGRSWFAALASMLFLITF
jgi:hypothetical protein